MDPLFITGLFTITGVILGAFLGYLTQLWRSVTDFRVSCRLVKFEIERNAAFLRVVQEDLKSASSRDAVDDIWRTSQLNLAFLLPDLEWDFLARHYALVPDLRANLDRAHKMDPEEQKEFKKEIHQRLVEMDIFKDIVAEMEARSRVKLFFHAIRGRTTHAEATRRTR